MARVDDLCELARSVIEAAADVYPIDGTTVTVECEDDPEVDTSEMSPGLMRVYVTWSSYADDGPANRREDATDYTLVILGVKVCETPGKVPTAWRRIRTDWVDTCVVRALADARHQLDGAIPWRLDDVSFDLEDLTERKAFWTGVAITLRDIR